MKGDGVLSFQDVLYREHCISDVIAAYAEELTSSGDTRDIMHANRLLSYQNMITDKVYENRLESFFDETYRLLDANHPRLGLDIEGRQKSLVSLEKKIQLYSALGKPLDLIRDCFAFRVLLYGDESLDLISHCYKITREIIDFAVTKGFSPCDRLPLIGVTDLNHPTNSYFEDFEYKHYIKDYIAFRKNNGYQSIHFVLVDTMGRYLEIQVRTLEMHATAQVGKAKHRHYKTKKYTEDLLPIDWKKVNMSGYLFFENEMFDCTGLIKPRIIYQRQKKQI